jgi:hypothetical protein
MFILRPLQIYILILLPLIFGLVPFGWVYLLKRIVLCMVCSMFCMTANARMIIFISGTLEVVCARLVYLLLSSGCRSVVIYLSPGPYK